MRWVSRIIALIVGNTVGVWIAATYIPGFVVSGGLPQMVGIAAVLTVLNLVLRPVLTLLLGPVILVTLGLGIVIVYAVILKILDILTQNLTIETIPALVLSAILFGLIHFVFHIASKPRRTDY